MIKEFEKAVSFAGWPPSEIAARKRDYVAKLNAFVVMHKEKKRALRQRQELISGSGVPKPTDRAGVNWWGQGVDLRNEEAVGQANQQELMEAGRHVMQEDVQRLANMERVVADTKAVGTTTLQELQSQTQQMEGMVDDLDDISFSLKRAQKLLRELMKGLATDKCFLFLFCKECSRAF